MSTIIYEANLL